MTAHGSGKAPKATHRTPAAKAKKFKIPPVTAQAPAGDPDDDQAQGLEAGSAGAEAGDQGRQEGQGDADTATFTDDLGQASKDSLKVKFKPKRSSPQPARYSLGGGGASVPSASAISLSAVCSLPEIRSPPMPRKPPDLSASAACWATAIANVR